MSGAYRNDIERGCFVWRLREFDLPERPARRRRPRPLSRWLLAFLVVAAASTTERAAVMCSEWPRQAEQRR